MIMHRQMRFWSSRQMHKLSVICILLRTHNDQKRGGKKICDLLSYPSGLTHILNEYTPDGQLSNTRCVMTATVSSFATRNSATLPDTRISFKLIYASIQQQSLIRTEKKQSVNRGIPCRCRGTYFYHSM